MSVDVVGIHQPVQDCVALVDRLPLTNQLVPMHEYSWQGGGKVATGLVAARRLGATAGMIAVVGDDAFGCSVARDFQWNDVDTSHLIVDKDRTTSFCISIAELETQGRSFVSTPGSCRALAPEDLDETYIASAKYLLLADITPVTVAAAKIARAHGVRVVFDADEYAAETAESLALIDVFIASEYFYQGMFAGGGFPHNCEDLRKRGPGIVVITLGSRGCVGLGPQGFFSEPAFTSVEVVDTTGAGDVYHGAFIYGLLRGWASRDVARFANAAAAIKCTRLGGRAALPGAATVMRFMEEGTIEYAEIDERVKRYARGFF